MQVSKWGNSLAVRIPRHMLKEHGIQEGDNVEITIRRVKSRKEALTDLKELGKQLPADFRIERTSDAS
ncbi:AbrB/MazE/SpoVT family DNA-binding domain-containing protein [Acetobacter aceti]|uniref:AbrB family transcriptional regulator n=1 Tax=Acetobacter aceti TaxID=435 RepID=A0A6S6PH71_ACEAC|nr:AbrB/MazE/SpoVT family DNA-binding domain-containing protein [Acetobacter aceti]BCI66015.1 AbrB family transcriptional regulator [Acetobacter aceti]